MLTVELTRTALVDRINDGGRVVPFSMIAAPEGRHVTSQVVHANGGAYTGR